MTGKTAIVGNGDGIMVFKAAGVATFPVSDEKNARDTLRKIAKEYQIIFITEDFARRRTVPRRSEYSVGLRLGRVRYGSVETRYGTRVGRRYTF